VLITEHDGLADWSVLVLFKFELAQIAVGLLAAGRCSAFCDGRE